MRSVTVNAPAKINLALHVGNKRPDGFHEIWSIMQAISLSDTLRVFISGASSDDTARKDSLVITGPEALALDGDDSENSNNLVLKAVRSLRQRIPDLPFVRLELVKNIPVGAGLGGGSSDAAATLKALNQVFDCGLNRAELSELGATLGSDIPFFFSRGSAVARGRGEILEEITLPLDYHLVLVTPAQRIATAAAYRRLGRPLSEESEQKRFLTSAQDLATFSGSSSAGDLLAFLETTRNDFQDNYLSDRNLASHQLEIDIGDFASTLREIDDELRGIGASFTRMSGSGSTVFAIFKAPPVWGAHGESFSQGESLGSIAGKGWRVIDARPITLDSCQ